MTLTFKCGVGCSVYVNQLAVIMSRPTTIPFKSIVIVTTLRQTHKHTYRVDCSTWATKMVGNYNAVVQVPYMLLLFDHLF